MAALLRNNCVFYSTQWKSNIKQDTYSLTVFPGMTAMKHLDLDGFKQ